MLIICALIVGISLLNTAGIAYLISRQIKPRQAHTPEMPKPKDQSNNNVIYLTPDHEDRVVAKLADHKGEQPYQDIW